MKLENIWNLLGPLLKAVLILIAGHILIVYLLKLLKRAFAKSTLDQSLVRFLTKAANIAAHVFVVLSALTVVGVSTTGLVAALSAAAVGVSVALKDSLSNVAGGILLLIAPRFVTGDYISAGGDEGTVTNVDLLHTTVRTADNRQVSIPNGVLINNHIINYSREPRRRVEIIMPVSFDSDIEAAKRAALETVRRHPLSLTEPDEAFVRVKNYDNGAVNLVVRVWCNTQDYWTLYYDLVEQIRVAFDAGNIRIPLNQLEVQIRDKASN
ncbi:MAG: mechanosensitive ion channel [Clostridia bacterium]|nr:mechanosensitive ion channel [Clostridia bacterium]